MKKILILLTVLALFLSVAVAEEGTDTFQWGEYGKVQLTQLTEWNDEITYQVDGSPEGKWIVAVFSIQDGGNFTADAMNLADDVLKLDEYTAKKKAAKGATIDIASGTITLTGTMAFIFDVPVDYDLSQGVLTVNGEKAVVPAA